MIAASAVTRPSLVPGLVANIVHESGRCCNILGGQSLSPTVFQPLGIGMTLAGGTSTNPMQLHINTSSHSAWTIVTWVMPYSPPAFASNFILRFLRSSGGTFAGIQTYEQELRDGYAGTLLGYWTMDRRIHGFGQVLNKRTHAYGSLRFVIDGRLRHYRTDVFETSSVVGVSWFWEASTSNCLVWWRSLVWNRALPLTEVQTLTGLSSIDQIISYLTSA